MKITNLYEFNSKHPREPIDCDRTLEEARLAADAGDWVSFIKAQGGIACRRKDRPIQLETIWSDKPGFYGEPIGERILGVTCGISTVVTRIHSWEICKHPLKTDLNLDFIRDEYAIKEDILAIAEFQPGSTPQAPLAHSAVKTNSVWILGNNNEQSASKRLNICHSHCISS